MKNTRSWKAICCKALSKMALCRRVMQPARTLSPALTVQEYKNIFALNFIKCKYNFRIEIADVGFLLESGVML